MNIREQRQQLKKLKRSLAAELAAKLTTDAAPEELAARKARIDHIDAALKSLVPSYWVRLRPVLLVAVSIALLATLSLVWRASFLPIVLDVWASAVTLEMASPARIENVRFANSVELRGVDWISSPRIPGETPSDEPIGVAELSAVWLRMDDLTIPEGAALELEVRDASLTAIVTSHRALESAFQLKGAATVAPGAQTLQFEFDEPEALRLGSGARADGASERTLEINGQLAPGMGFSFDLNPASLRFVERVASGTGGQAFASSVLEGTISISAMERTEKLELGDVIVIGGLSVEMARVTVDDRIHLRLRGVAGDIRVGSGNFARHVAPTMLEYLAKNHILALLWTLAGTLGGLLWSIVRFFED
jgi:hypothetical protein